jgi:predicted transcriptional regulator
MNKVPNKNQFLTFRSTSDFCRKFDELCERLGYRRSTVVRYCLKRFLNETWNNSDNFKRVRAELY